MLEVLKLLKEFKDEYKNDKSSKRRRDCEENTKSNKQEKKIWENKFVHKFQNSVGHMKDVTVKVMPGNKKMWP